MANRPGKQRPEECCRPSATQSMNLWQVLFLLTLGRCSGVSETLFDAYPFDLVIKIPGVNLSKYVLETEEVPFVAKKEITAGGLRLRGIPLGDPDDRILVKWESPEGETNPVAIEFSFLKLDVTDQGCKLYPAAVIEIGEYSFYESNRERLFDAMDTLSKRIEYPMKRMKVQPPLNPNENWRLGLMASENCPGENSTQIWTAINRIVEKIHGDDIGEIDGVSPKARVTKEFSEIFRNLPRRLGPNEGIDRGIAFPSTPTNGTIEGRSNDVVMTLAASSASSSTLSASIVEPIETSTEVRTTTSTEVPPTTTTEISTTTSTEVPTTTTTEVPTTTSTEVPTTTPTEVPTATSTEVPTTTSTEVPTTTSTEVPLTTSTEVPPTTSTKAPAARTTDTPPIMPTASVATSTTSEIQFLIVTEIALAGEEDVETARRLDEENPETFIEQNSGASVAMPLFAIIVLLAITSAVAVFTVARARNVHRKTFVIGNASPDEINDIVVLGSDDVFN